MKASVQIALSRALSLAAMLGVNAVLARTVGKDGFGEYTYAVVVQLFVIMVINQGFQTGFVYMLANNRITPNEAVGLTGVLTLIVAALMAVAWFVTAQFGWHPQKLSPTYMALIYASVPVFILQSSLAGIARGLKWFRLYSVSTAATAVGCLAATALTIFLISRSVEAAFAIRVFSFVIGIVMVVAVLVGARIARPRFNLRSLGAITYYGFKIHIADMLYLVSNRIDVLIAGIFLTKGQLGVYAAGVSLVEKMLIVPDALCTAGLTQVTHENQGNPSLVARYGRITVVVTVALSAVMVLGGFFFIWALYGTEFLGAYPIILILLVGVFSLALTRVLNIYFLGMDMGYLISTYTAIGAGINIGLNFLLIPLLGIVGAAITSSISYSIVAGLYMVSYCRRTHAAAGQVLRPRMQDVREVAALVGHYLPGRLFGRRGGT